MFCGHLYFALKAVLSERRNENEVLHRFIGDTVLYHLHIL
jgi:hypothetical protein